MHNLSSWFRCLIRIFGGFPEHASAANIKCGIYNDSERTAANWLQRYTVTVPADISCDQHRPISLPSDIRGNFARIRWTNIFTSLYVWRQQSCVISCHPPVPADTTLGASGATVRWDHRRDAIRVLCCERLQAEFGRPHRIPSGRKETTWTRMRRPLNTWTAGGSTFRVTSSSG